MRSVQISITFLATMFLAIPSGYAVKYHNIKGAAPSALPFEASIRVIEQNRAILGWEKLELSPSKVVSLGRNQIAVFEQVHKGMRVVGREVKVELDHTGRPIRVWGDPALKISIVEAPFVNPVEAIMAIEDLEERVLPLDLGGELVILAHQKRARVAYSFAVSTGFKLHKYFVDAITGQIILKQKGWLNARGKVFLIDPAITPDATEVELLNLTADATYLDGYEGQFKVWQCVTAPEAGGMMGGGTPDVENATLIPIPTSDASGNFIYDPILDVDYTEFAGAVNLYYHVDLMYSHFRSLGYVAPLNMDIIANLHSEANGTKTPYDNAFFTPSADMSKDIITAGQGSIIDLAYGGDVIMHEFTHSVIYHVAIGLDAPQFDQYGINRMPNAIHEGLADYFPSSLNDSPVMGAWALEELQAGASRNLGENTKVCPDDMMGEEHYDGEILGAATWAIREAVGGRDVADPIIYATLGRLTSNANYQDFYEALVVSLDDALSAGDISQTQYDDALAVSRAKGLDICGRFIPLSDQESHSMSFGLNTIASAMGGSCSDMRGLLANYGALMPTLFQYSFQVPETATSLTFTLNFSPLEMGSDMQYRVYGRGGEMVQYDLVSAFGGFQLPVPADFDMEFSDGGAAFTATQTELVWTIDDDTPLPVGQEVFFAIAHVNCPSSDMTVAITTSDDPIVDPDAGVDGDTDGDTDADGGTEPPKTSEDGCKCSHPGVGGRGSAPLFFLLMGVAAALIIRRKVFSL